MRTPGNNPFQAGSDQIPSIWAGRDLELSDWRDRVRPRRITGQYERGRVVLGEPGIGKSVLVRRIAADATGQGDLVTAQLRVARDASPIPMVAEALLDLAGQVGLPARREASISQLLARVEEVSIAKAGIHLAPETQMVPPHTALTRLFVAVARAARDDDRMVLVHLDEVQNITDPAVLSQLFIALGDALSYQTTVDVPGGRLDVGLPLAVYLTGLPEFADMASSRQGATFARRFGTTLLDPLDDEEIRAALRPLITQGWSVHIDSRSEEVVMTPAAVDAVIAKCLGDPFLFQLVGQHAWDSGSTRVIDAADVDNGWSRARREAVRHVERLLSRLPAAERALIDVMAELSPDDRTATGIARALGMSQASEIGTTAQRLDTIRGIIVRGKPYTFRVRTIKEYLQGQWP